MPKPKPKPKTRHKTKTETEHEALPPRVDFATWRKRFESLMGSREPSHKAFRKLVAANARKWSEISKKFVVPPIDPEDEVLREIYEVTLPYPEADWKFAKSQNSDRRKLKDLLKQMSNFVDRFTPTNSSLTVGKTYFTVRFEPLLERLRKTLLYGNEFLSLIDQPTTVRLNVEENQLVNVFGEFGICLGGLKSA
jgi:hypothetical protein